MTTQTVTFSENTVPECIKLIRHLDDLKKDFNLAEENGELTGDEAQDKFSDILHSYNLGYSEYCELLDVVFQFEEY